MKPGNVILFYRTKEEGHAPAYHTGVATTIGIVESIRKNILDFEQFKVECGKRTVFTDKQLFEMWDNGSGTKPFIVNFLNAWHFGTPKPTRQDLIRLQIIPENVGGPRGFELIPWKPFDKLIKEFYNG